MIAIHARPGRDPMSTTQPSFITGVDFVTVPTNDFEASRNFYGASSACPRSSSGARCRPSSSRPAR